MAWMPASSRLIDAPKAWISANLLHSSLDEMTVLRTWSVRHDMTNLDFCLAAVASLRLMDVWRCPPNSQRWFFAECGWDDDHCKATAPIDGDSDGFMDVI